MKSWRWAVGVCMASTVLAWPVSAVAGTPSDESRAPEKVQLLDVPFVPQSEALCGGAALAMVLRYWGMPGVLAEDFAALVEPGSAGIRTSALVQAVEAYGWTAFPVSGTPAEVESHLAGGRPIIALIRVGSDSFHYVVLVAWANGWVVVQDPNVGPFRAIREEEFEAAWSGSDRWALLVLPPPRNRWGGRAGSRSGHLTIVCRPRRVQRPGGGGDPIGSGWRHRGGGTQVPGGPVPVSRVRRSVSGTRRSAVSRRGLGGSEPTGRSAPWRSTRAIPISWRLLAGSRFLDGDVEGALRAWNHLSEPRADLTRIDGLTRIRYSAVAGQLDLPPGRLLTPQAFRQARRRLAEVPAQQESRMSVRPMPGGIAQVNVTLLERPPVFDGPWDVGSAGVKALTGHEVTLDVASPTGNGELWVGGWRWQSNRPRVSLALAVPVAGIRPGIWRVDGYWERQTYAARFLSDTSGMRPPGAEPRGASAHRSFILGLARSGPAT